MRVARGFWAMWALSLELAMGNGQWESVVGRVGQRTPLLWTLVTDHAKTSDAIMTVTALHGQTRSTSTSAFNASKATTSQKGKKEKKEKRMETNFHHLSSVICFPPGVSLSEWVRLFETLSTIRYIGYFSIKSPHSIFSVCKLPRETHSRTLQTALVENAELMHTIISLKRGN